MSELTSELQRMADDAARQARPPAAADIIRQGDRRRSLTRRSLGGLSVAGIAGASVALSLGLTGSPSAHGTGTIRTAAFTLVSNANGTATLTINPKVLTEPGILQRDLAKDGIPATVRVGSYCTSNPAPAGFTKVVSFQGSHAVTINPAAMPAGTELSFGNVQLTNGRQIFFTLIDAGSYTCTTAPTTPTGDGAQLGPS